MAALALARVTPEMPAPIAASQRNRPGLPSSAQTSARAKPVASAARLRWLGARRQATPAFSSEQAEEREHV